MNAETRFGSDTFQIAARLNYALSHSTYRVSLEAEVAGPYFCSEVNLTVKNKNKSKKIEAVSNCHKCGCDWNIHKVYLVFAVLMHHTQY